MIVLVAEDDKDMQKILLLYLKKEGYEVLQAFNGEEAMEILMERQVDLLLLDWMMPKRDGIWVCRELRKLNYPVKIIMLTAKTANTQEYQGLSCGADDYLRKPFDMKVLLLRIKKLCRQERKLVCGRLELNQDTMEVKLGEERIILTKTEWELLRYFMVNKGILLNRDMILNQVWGMDYEGDLRTVDTHVRRLRKKIGNEYIRTNIGLGYVLEDQCE